VYHRKQVLKNGNVKYKRTGSRDWIQTVRQKCILLDLNRKFFWTFKMIWRSVLIAISHAVFMLKTYWRNSTVQFIFFLHDSWKVFCNFEKHMSPQPMDKYESRVRPMNRNLVNNVPINVISPTLFQLYHLGNGNDDISSEEHLKIQKISRGYYLYLKLFIFCSYIWIISRDPVPFLYFKIYLWLLPVVIWQYNSNCWNRNYVYCVAWIYRSPSLSRKFVAW
jgi:hypothetical protein